MIWYSAVLVYFVQPNVKLLIAENSHYVYHSFHVSICQNQHFDAAMEIGQNIEILRKTKKLWSNNI